MNTFCELEPLDERVVQLWRFHLVGPGLTIEIAEMSRLDAVSRGRYQVAVFDLPGDDLSRCHGTASARTRCEATEVAKHIVGEILAEARPS